MGTGRDMTYRRRYVRDGFPHQDFIGHRPLWEPMPKRRERRKKGSKEGKKKGHRRDASVSNVHVFVLGSFAYLGQCIVP
jgi:hypothetical protein